MLPPAPLKKGAERMTTLVGAAVDVGDHGWLGRLAAERNVGGDSGIGGEINSSICCSTLGNGGVRR